MATDVTPNEFFETADISAYPLGIGIGIGITWLIPIDVPIEITTVKLRFSLKSLVNPSTKVKISLYDSGFNLVYGDETSHALTVGLNDFFIPKITLGADTYFFCFRVDVSASAFVNHVGPTKPAGTTEAATRFKSLAFAATWPALLSGSSENISTYGYCAIFVLPEEIPLQRTYKIEDAIATIQALFRSELPGVSNPPDFIPDQPPPGTINVLTRPLSVIATPESAGLSRFIHTIQIIVQVYRGHQTNALDKLIDYGEFIPSLLAQNQDLARSVDTITNLRSNGIVPANYAGLNMLGYIWNLDLHMLQTGSPAIGKRNFAPMPDICFGIRGAIEAFQAICREEFSNIRIAPDLAPDQAIYPAIICLPGAMTGQFQSSGFNIQLQNITVEVHIADASDMEMASEVAYPFGDLIPLIQRGYPTLNGSITGFSGPATGRFTRMGWGLTPDGRESIGWRFQMPIKLLQGQV